MRLGQGGHHLRVISDKSGVDDIVLKEMTNQLVNQTSSGTRSTTFNIELLAQILEKLISRGVYRKKNRVSQGLQ